MKKLGLIVNPIAGLGGRLARKGSDEAGIRKLAQENGLQSQSPARAASALQTLADMDFTLLTCAGEMGEGAALAAGFTPEIVYRPQTPTCAADTIAAAHALEAAGIDLLLFVGGDGTARCLYEAIACRVPALGVPAGVKIHSAVYALNPRTAGQAARRFLAGECGTVEAEVMDVDEEAFRRGQVCARLYGYLLIPHDKRALQNAKSASCGGAPQALALEVLARMEEDPAAVYLIGPGTTTRAVLEALKLPCTLLGVDIVQSGRLLHADADESTILHAIEGQRAYIVVTCIGAQGHIFGRGNQQLSPAVIRRVSPERIIVIATPEKLASLQLRPLFVDTGDEALDRTLCGYRRIITGLGQETVCRIEA